MKNLLLITVFLVAMTTNLMAQDKNVIEIKDISGFAKQNENNQFKIVAHEELDIRLKFDLKKEEQMNIVVLNKLNKVVHTKELFKEGENKINFSMEENELYTVKLISKKTASMIVCLSEN